MDGRGKYFYATVCHVCKKNSKEAVLKVCSSCKLISYCGPHHQKAHWPQHKQICRCVNFLINKSRARHLFHKTEKLDYREWIRRRACYVQLIQRIVRRSLVADEEQLFRFPAVCNTCHQYAQPMLPCTECNAVVYCSEAHRKDDTTHSKNCTKLKIAFTIDMYVSRNHYSTPMVSSLCPVLSNNRKLPSCMEMFIKEYVKSCEEDISYFLDSELLSCPLTVIYALLFENLGSKTELTIHVVGADKFEFSVLPMWEILFHWFPNLKCLNLILIGPEILKITPELKPKLCSDCTITRTLIVDSQACCYHDYFKSDNVCIPNVVVAFNCGFNEYKMKPESDVWKSSIPCFSTFCGIPVILTSYTKEESKEDLLRLLDLKLIDKDYSVILACEQNPFASCYPRRDWETPNGVFYVNYYVTLVETCLAQCPV